MITTTHDSFLAEPAETVSLWPWAVLGAAAFLGFAAAALAAVNILIA